ncbi:MAG: hypothetical protein JO190_06625 [Candidatus Eremiobacteraeota bacterium]|nr:hypothetical protein [Candidatus Eremiobacteraeota bacterium]MBV8499087.1 hypothetical protein [Candidatus Eremiobacteraeota bacterium]
MTKDVVIGSTVDPGNGDMGPRALSLVPLTFGVLTKGELLVCNFEDSSGTAGNGTTVEILKPTTGAKPTTFVQSSQIQGCNGDAISSGDAVFGAGMSSGVVEKYSEKAKPIKTYGSPIAEPLDDGDADCSLPYAPEKVYVGDAKTGSVVNFAAGLYGQKNPVAVITGFAVSGSGWNALGPVGMQYNAALINHGHKCNDTLYIADGVDNTLVAVSKVSNLLTTGEIKVLPGGKKFKCKQKRFSCASVVYSGSPLNAPVALAILPNGNLVAANGAGGNTLVEISAAGAVLATKTLNTDSSQEVYGLLATGKTDSNTALFYTDTKDNSVHELEQ